MNEQVVTIIVSVLGSGAVLKVVDAIVTSFKEKRKKPSAMEEGLRWLLQDKLEYLATKEIKNGETTRQMKVFLHRGHDFYHSLGGDGDMAGLMEDYDQLPVRY